MARHVSVRRQLKTTPTRARARGVPTVPLKWGCLQGDDLSCAENPEGHQECWCEACVPSAEQIVSCIYYDPFEYSAPVGPQGMLRTPNPYGCLPGDKEITENGKKVCERCGKDPEGHTVCISYDKQHYGGGTGPSITAPPKRAPLGRLAAQGVRVPGMPRSRRRALRAAARGGRASGVGRVPLPPTLRCGDDEVVHCENKVTPQGVIYPDCWCLPSQYFF